MSAASQDRIQRPARLEKLLPKPGTLPAYCLDSSRLLEILGDAHGESSIAARRRALQRDLEKLAKAGRIEAVNPGGKPLRDRRNGDAPDEDALIWEYTLRQVHDLIAEALPKRQFDRLWKRLLHELNRLLLTERQLRIVSDTLHLRPVELYPEVLHAVIDALVRRPALAVIDVNVAGERSTPILHPLPQVARFNNNRSTHRMVEKTRRLRHV